MALGTPMWGAILATVCAGWLLFAFQQVVHTGVRQAEVRNRAVIEHADAVWRCNHKIGLDQRDSCRNQLVALRQERAAVHSPAGIQPATASLAGH